MVGVTCELLLLELPDGRDHVGHLVPEHVLGLGGGLHHLPGEEDQGVGCRMYSAAKWVSIKRPGSLIETF